MGRNPNLGREIFHSESPNNSNLHFIFAILIRQNKRNHLLFYVLSFIQFWARKLPRSTVVLKLMLTIKYFLQNCMLTNCLRWEDSELYLGSRQNVFPDPSLKFLFMYAGQLIASSYMWITTIPTEDLSLHDVWDCFFRSGKRKISALMH